ncbi:hypothetical protein [Variovorax atrisoli]|uniref:hypothetical protein n=1 Tax=Variovorax atrisoli TaxID=3394203 RepID=UPI0033963833
MASPPSKDAISGSGATPSNAQARAGFGALWENLWGAGGLLGASGLPSDARVALGIGSVFSFRNKLINGGFALNQRGYASGAATVSSNQYTLDRWRVVTLGQALTYSASAPGNAVVAPAGGIEQVIEGNNIEGGVYTLSWVGAGTATVNGAAVANGGQTVALAAGANVTVKFIGAVAKAQFEFGSVATPFEQRHAALELFLCQRYFETGSLKMTSAYPGGSSNAQLTTTICFKATKRAAPTMTQLGTSTSSNVSANSFVSPDTNGAAVNMVIGAAAGLYSLNLDWTASAEL